VLDQNWKRYKPFRKNAWLNQIGDRLSAEKSKEPSNPNSQNSVAAIDDLKITIATVVIAIFR